MLKGNYLGKTRLKIEKKYRSCATIIFFRLGVVQLFFGVLEPVTKAIELAVQELKNEYTTWSYRDPFITRSPSATIISIEFHVVTIVISPSKRFPRILPKGRKSSQPKRMIQDLSKS